MKNRVGTHLFHGAWGPKRNLIKKWPRQLGTGHGHNYFTIRQYSRIWPFFSHQTWTFAIFSGSTINCHLMASKYHFWSRVLSYWSFKAFRNSIHFAFFGSLDWMWNLVLRFENWATDCLQRWANQYSASKMIFRSHQLTFNCGSRKARALQNSKDPLRSAIRFWWA